MEYSESDKKFMAAFNSGMKGVEAFSVGYNERCDFCEDYGDPENEGFFSHSSCEICGSSMAGDRYAAHGLIDGNLAHFEVCQDCVLYHSNGDLPEGWG